MGFENLSVEMQNILIEEHYLFSKKLIIFILLGLAIAYLFFWKQKKEQPTGFISFGLFRLLATIASIALLIVSPMLVLFFDPRASFMDIFETFLSFYFMLVTIVVIFAFFNWFYYVPQFLMKMMGMDVTNPNVNRWYTKYFKRRGDKNARQ